jgi:hypothetical protein
LSARNIKSGSGRFRGFAGEHNLDESGGGFCPFFVETFPGQISDNQMPAVN